MVPLRVGHRVQFHEIPWTLVPPWWPPCWKTPKFCGLKFTREFLLWYFILWDIVNPQLGSGVGLGLGLCSGLRSGLGLGLGSGLGIGLGSVAYLGGGMRPWPPPRKVRKHFLTRYTVKNGISNLYILLKSVFKMQEMPFQRPKFQNGISNLYIFLKSALKMQEMPFHRPKFQKISGGHAPGPPYNCVVTMASPSLKSWLRHWLGLDSVRGSTISHKMKYLPRFAWKLCMMTGDIFYISFQSDYLLSR